MPKLKKNSSLADWQKFCEDVYGFPNDRDFGTMEMLSNVQRFTMRSLKGIRKADPEKTASNLLIGMSWYISLMNQFHLDVSEIVWQRFPAACSYCGATTCECKARKIKKRQSIKINPKLKPKTIKEYQNMFGHIYPAETRTLENAGIHLAEEMGEITEAMLAYRGSHGKENFDKVVLESADIFSTFMGVFNSLEIDVAEELAKKFHNNCHVCHQAPCECNFNHVLNFKS